MRGKLIMKHKYWLVLGVASIGAMQAAACSSNFDSCADSRSCASAGSAGEAGQPETGKGEAGQATDGGAAGAPVGDGGAAGTSNGKPTLFGDCSAVGQPACQDSASAQRLACDGKKWQAGTTCADGELCDSGSGACVAVVAECAAAKPGQKVCRADKILTCGPDLVTADEGAACDGTCKDGVCVAPTCGDQKVEAGEDCDDDALTASGACVKCKDATCGDGVVYVGHEECDDGNVLPGDGCGATCAAEPVALALGAAHSCALSSIGVVKCWGDNAHGALGLGDTVTRGDGPGQMGSKLSAVSLGTNRFAKAISATSAATCALLDNGDVKCWGANDSGQLGTGDQKDRGDELDEMGDTLKAIGLGGGHLANSVSIGGGHTCAVLDSGIVKCWGAGGAGQLGQDDQVSHPLVDQLPGISLGTNRTAKTVSAGAQATTCAVLDDGTAKCWGNTSGGALANGETHVDMGGDPRALGDFPGEMAALPALGFGAGRSAKWIVAADAMSCALLDDDSVKCWGDGSNGRLGQGNINSLGTTVTDLAALLPVNTGTGRKVKSMSAQ
jgi:cysteine-rich repeat protein